MRRFPFASIYRACCVLALFCAPALLASCTDRGYVTPSRPVTSATSPDDLSGPILADISLAYEACLERCNEQSSLGALTREGCFKGCAESRRRVEFRDKVFTSRQECFDALYAVELNRDLIIEDHQAWCKKQWSHLYKRRGCEDAVAVFYAHITAPEVCGGSNAPYASSRPADVGVTPLGSAPGAAQPASPPTPAVQPAPSVTVVPAPDGGYLQDTPKYQTTPAKKPTKKKSSPSAKAKKPTQAAPKAPQKDTPAPDAREKDTAVSPPAAAQSAPGQAAPARATPPQSPAPVQPAAAPRVPAATQPSTPPAVPTSTPPATPAGQPQPVAPAPAPTPQQAEPAPEQTGPVDSVVPMPSMLERPYTAPPVLSPSTPPPVPPLPPVEQTLPPADPGRGMP